LAIPHQAEFFAGWRPRRTGIPLPFTHSIFIFLQKTTRQGIRHQAGGHTHLSKLKSSFAECFVNAESALSARKHHAFIFGRLRCFEKIEAALAKTSIAITRPGKPPTSSNALNLSNVED
jgi:hypothetical protein